MSGRKRYKLAMEKGEAGGFVRLFHVVLRSESFARLRPYGVKLLLDLLTQYKGENNGDLSATWAGMKMRGWRSKTTLAKAIKELLAGEWIEVARRGGLNRCTLYAVTFFAVDDCKGKLDISATHSPKSLWRRHEPVPPLASPVKPRSGTPSGPVGA